MALSPEHIPLPCSLRERVSRDFEPRDAALSDNAFSTEELVSFLAKSKDTDSSPFATIRRRAAKQNRSADLNPEDHAALAWVCEAFSDWEESYPLEQPLHDQIRRLLPLAIAMALTDSAFFTPGAHPLHRLLDALQSGSVGWQVRLDRAGQMLEQRVERSVEKALEWFQNPRTDIAAITREFESANERDSARAQRMVQRLAETEEAQLKTLSARRDAALMINEGLGRMSLPAAIGEFLKGPWYDSAQLALVKFGNKSREWQQMERATTHLMESVQPPSGAGEAERDRQEQILRHLPGELRRWLLSLEHDSDATDSAIGLVEYAHLRVQHGQQLQLVRIPPIPVEDEQDNTEEYDDAEYQNGDWYRFEDDEGELRAQLVLQIQDGQHLLFANFVGLKALDLSRRAFSLRIKDDFALPLPSRDTFSISLAGAAGINSEDKLRQLIDPSYQPSEPEPEPEPEPPGVSDSAQGAAEDQTTAPMADAPSPDGEVALRDPADDDVLTVEDSEAATWDEELPDLSGASDYDPVLTPPEGAEIDLTLELDDIPPEPMPPPVAQAAPRAPTHAAPEPPAATMPGAAPTPTPAPPPVPPPVAPPPATPPPVAPPAAAAPHPAATREVDVPMGAWLGFHDGEMPIMAKLAVYDPRRDNYIFVNRKGIALRELNRAELLTLMDQGLVDILETRCYFRDEVERARGEDQ